MTPEQKLAALKSRIDEAKNYFGRWDKKPGLEPWFHNVETGVEAIEILSRLIEQMPPPITDARLWHIPYNELRQTIIGLITESE